MDCTLVLFYALVRMSCLGKSRVGFRYVDGIRAHVLPMGFVSHRRKCPCVFFVFSLCFRFVWAINVVGVTLSQLIL